MADATVTHGGTHGLLQLGCHVLTNDDSHEYHRSVAQFVIDWFDVCPILKRFNHLYIIIQPIRLTRIQQTKDGETKQFDSKIFTVCPFHLIKHIKQEIEEEKGKEETVL